MTYGKGFKKKFGFAEQVDFTLAVKPTDYLELISEDLKAEPPNIKSNSITGSANPNSAIEKGEMTVSGSIDFEVIPNGTFGKLLKHTLGSVNSVEQSVITIDDNNKYLDFKEDAGVELTAIITPGSYLIGETQADAGSLCKAIYDAIVALAELGTYEITYSRTAKKFTITETGGVVTELKLLFNTGTNTANSIAVIIGFSTDADLTGTDTYTSATEVQFVFKHTFTLTDELPEFGTSIDVDRDIGIKLFSGLKINTMTITAAMKAILVMKMDLVGRNCEDGLEADFNGLIPSIIRKLTFRGANFKIDNVSQDLGNLSLVFNNNLFLDDYKSNSEFIKSIERNDCRLITGSITNKYDSIVSSAWAKFIAGTLATLEATWEGSVLNGAYKYYFKFSSTDIKYEPFTPGTGGKVMPDAVMPFEAYNLTCELQNDSPTI